ncbi:MAG TPA: poly(3-hydroxyalkanoate) granule-associated protein PhaF, partial [Candidatus Dormibacteraeota bacterium]
GLRTEVAQLAKVKLPAAIPATIVARPRRDDKAANGKSKPVAGGATRPAAKPAAKPGRKAEAKKST